MSATTYLTLAYSAVILGLGGYLAWMFSTSARLARREQQMELLRDDDE
ncbi:MAG: CcmD family protein [Proteobacteria bacterium]|nr:CcmD family protein [Pseudomonadota bacterium]MBU1612196.1 CcmD family protein [Pseudomonadota bacterium]